MTIKTTIKAIVVNIFDAADSGRISRKRPNKMRIPIVASVMNENFKTLVIGIEKEDKMLSVIIIEKVFWKSNGFTYPEFLKFCLMLRF